MGESAYFVKMTGPQGRIKEICSCNVGMNGFYKTAKAPEKQP